MKALRGRGRTRQSDKDILKDLVEWRRKTLAMLRVVRVSTIPLSPNVV